MWDQLAQLRLERLVFKKKINEYMYSHLFYRQDNWTVLKKGDGYLFRLDFVCFYPE